MVVAAVVELPSFDSGACNQEIGAIGVIRKVIRVSIFCLGGPLARER